MQSQKWLGFFWQKYPRASPDQLWWWPPWRQSGLDYTSPCTSMCIHTAGSLSQSYYVLGPSKRSCKCHCVKAMGSMNPRMGYNKTRVKDTMATLVSIPRSYLALKSKYSMVASLKHDLLSVLLVLSIVMCLAGALKSPSRPQNSSFPLFIKLEKIRFPSKPALLEITEVHQTIF